MTPFQSLVKAIIWRVIAISITMSMIYYISGSIIITSGAGLIELVGKTLLYYIYDRIWNRLEEK